MNNTNFFSAKFIFVLLARKRIFYTLLLLQWKYLEELRRFFNTNRIFFMSVECFRIGCRERNFSHFSICYRRLWREFCSGHFFLDVLMNVPDAFFVPDDEFFSNFFPMFSKNTTRSRRFSTIYHFVLLPMNYFCHFNK